MNKWSKRFIGIGLLCLLTAVCLTAYNFWSDARAGKTADHVLRQMDQLGGDSVQDEHAAKEVPDYILNPRMDMPTQEIDGQNYIGTLQIDTLELSLPVISEWSYSRLQIAPCRYTGSVYMDNMVIAAHNYTSHFGRLKELSQGDTVTFTDIDGNVFRYQVTDIETLQPYSVMEMTSGDWDLTLFTCTIGGRTRVTVRCERTADANIAAAPD